MAARIVESTKRQFEETLDDGYQSPDEALFDLYEQARREVILSLPYGTSTARAVVIVTYQVIVDD